MPPEASSTPSSAPRGAPRRGPGAGARRASRARCRQIAHQPFGHACSCLMAIGLGGYALWRFAQAFVGQTPEYGEHSTLDRIGAVGSGMAYAAFCLLAISVLRGTAATPRRSPADDRGRPALAGRSRNRRRSGSAVHRRRRLPGVSRAQQEVPRVLEDRPDVAGVFKAFKTVGTAGLVARAVAFALIGCSCSRRRSTTRPSRPWASTARLRDCSSTPTARSADRRGLSA